MIEPGLPALKPLFPVRTYGADTTCADVHPGGPLPVHSRLCCMVCSRTGDAAEARIRAEAQRTWAAERAALRAHTIAFKARIKAERKARRREGD